MLLRRSVSSEGDVAAVILEPTGASWDAAPKDFLPPCESPLRHNTVLIFDEVVTGFRVAPGAYRRAVA
jgi:glutamate-1-semialdehyde 2,1-aminomutase